MQHQIYKTYLRTYTLLVDKYLQIIQRKIQIVI